MKFYVFMTNPVKRFAVENLHRQEAEVQLPESKVVQHPEDTRIIWFDEEENDDVREIEMMFESILSDLSKDNYAILEIPDVLGVTNWTQKTETGS